MSFRKIPPDNLASPACRVPWWNYCKACDREFKWEYAWRGMMTHEPNRSVFVCKQCEPTAQGASKYFGDFVYPTDLK